MSVFAESVFFNAILPMHWIVQILSDLLQACTLDGHPAPRALPVDTD